jgi:hypothetical protein
MLENKLQIAFRIFGPYRRNDTGKNKLLNKDLHSLHSSQHIITVIKSRRMNLGTYSTHRGDEKYIYNLFGNPQGKG